VDLDLDLTGPDLLRQVDLAQGQLMLPFQNKRTHLRHLHLPLLSLEQPRLA
jgi:hypothetical protein